MQVDNDLYSEGEPDPKPYKIYLVNLEGGLVEKIAEYATEAEAKAHPHLGRNLRIILGNRMIPW